MEAGAILLGLIIIASVSETYIMRNDLKAHNLQIWLYAAFPLLTITGIAIVFREVLPEDLENFILYWLSALAIALFFFGTIVAMMRSVD